MSATAMGSFCRNRPHQYDSSQPLPRCSMRLLFSSIHCYLDPTSGAALCTRELLELLAGRGTDCRVLTIGILDPVRETSLGDVFATLELPVRRFQEAPGPKPEHLGRRLRLRHQPPRSWQLLNGGDQRGVSRLARSVASSSSRCSIQLFRSCIPSPSRKARRTQRVTQ